MRDSFSVTARFTQAVVQAAQRHGASVPDAWLPALTQGSRVGVTQQDALWSLFADVTHADPMAALQLGADLQAGNLDLVGMLLLSCDTLGDALEVLTEYAPIIGDNARFETETAGSTVQLSYLPDYTVCRAQRVEAAMACAVSLARWMTKDTFCPREIWFVHTPRADALAMASAMGCMVKTGQSANAVLMDVGELARPLMQAGQQLHTHLRRLADEMLASLAQGSVSAQVQQLIRQNPRWGKERIAERLGMSGRNLNRKLAAEAISFKGLREALLYDLAAQALRERHGVAAVTERLGFSDENAFSRAFRRWSGQTPAQFARSQ
jgi:AraC-like DNA-binding protein